MKKISIIIPVYNIEDYIEKCIKSIIYQDYENLEIILVNDGSTDNSLKICEKYSKKDKRIKILSQENQGLSMARNNALKVATGDYIWFIDGDDYIEENSFEIIKKYIDNDYDIIISDYYEVKNNKNKLVKIKGENYSDNIRYVLSHCIVWNKIIKKKLLDYDFFPKGQYYEDLYSIPILVLKIKKYKFIDETLYNYVRREGSITNSDETNLIKRFDDYYSGINNIYNNLYRKYPEEVEFIFIRNFLFFFIIEEVKTKKNHNIKYINNLVKEKFPKYYKNKYYKKTPLKKIFAILVYNEIYWLAKLIVNIKLKVSNT